MKTQKERLVFSNTLRLKEEVVVYKRITIYAENIFDIVPLCGRAADCDFMGENIYMPVSDRNKQKLAEKSPNIAMSAAD